MTKWNIIINYMVTFWNVFSIYVFLPINLALLGGEAFGIISYAATIQAFVSLLEAGVSTVLKRDFAIESDTHQKTSLLYSVEIIYLTLTLFILASSIILGPYVTPKILHVTSIPKSDINIAFICIIGITLTQVLFIIYQGALWGLGQINQSNSFQFLQSLLKNGAVCLFVFLVGGGLIAFFAFQVVVQLMFLFLIRKSTYAKLREATIYIKPVFSQQLIKKNLSFAGGIFAISLLATINSQTDKLLLGSTLPIEHLTVYYTSFTISQSSVLLVSPLVNLFFPKISQLMAQEFKEKLLTSITTIGLIVFFISISISSILFNYNEVILKIWIQNESFENLVSKILPFVLIGGLLQAFTVLPFSISLAAKDSKTITRIQIFIMLFSIPLMYILISMFGIKGAAVSWAITNLLSAPIYTYIVLNKHIGKLPTLSYFKDFACAFTIIFSFHFILSNVLSFYKINTFTTNVIFILLGIALSCITLANVITNFSIKNSLAIIKSN